MIEASMVNIAMNIRNICVLFVLALSSSIHCIGLEYCTPNSFKPSNTALTSSIVAALTYTVS